MKTKKVIAHIRNWLNKYANNAGTEGFVVGVSGGIDSAVTSTLAAITNRPVLCIKMPIHQAPDQTRKGQLHINWLIERNKNVSSITLDLTEAFDSLINSFPAATDGIETQKAFANTRARLRMTTLYYFASTQNVLVVGTGNKVEDFGVGFYTKYGDGGVDLSPIADLTKTEVYTVASELGIISEIQDAAPTDGLWSDGRTDEDQLGATYSELEWAMAFSGNEAELNNVQKNILLKYRTLHQDNRHKMIQIPVCKIPKTLR